MYNTLFMFLTKSQLLFSPVFGSDDCHDHAATCHHKKVTLNLCESGKLEKYVHKYCPKTCGHC